MDRLPKFRTDIGIRDLLSVCTRLQDHRIREYIRLMKDCRLRGLKRLMSHQAHSVGIAGYTLVVNSYGMRLVAHEPFESTESAILHESDIFSDSFILETTARRQKIADTDIGAELRESIHQLEELLQAYRDGILIEKIV